jgi:hypothetical protein
MERSTSPLQSGADGPAAAGQAAPAIPYHAYVLAAAYLKAGKDEEDAAALARLFDAMPHMETSIRAAMRELKRLGDDPQ